MEKETEKTPHIVVFASNPYHLAIDNAFESASLAEEYIKNYTRMDRGNLIVRPFTTVLAPLEYLTELTHIKKTF